MLVVLFLAFALVLAVLAAVVSPSEPWRGRLLCFSLACFFAAELTKTIPLLAR
jgi:hypothetical protein